VESSEKKSVQLKYYLMALHFPNPAQRFEIEVFMTRGQGYGENEAVYQYYMEIYGERIGVFLLAKPLLFIF